MKHLPSFRAIGLGILLLASASVQASFAPSSPQQLAAYCQPGSPMLNSDLCWGQAYGSPYAIGYGSYGNYGYPGYGYTPYVYPYTTPGSYPMVYPGYANPWARPIVVGQTPGVTPWGIYQGGGGIIGGGGIGGCEFACGGNYGYSGGYGGGGYGYGGPTGGAF
jgi:hypothetical protein